MRRLIVGFAVFFVAGGAPLGARQIEIKSPDVVKQLAAAMAEHKLTAIATKHPTEADRYVAALLFPGVQLLVISARSAAPAYIDAQLSAAAYQNVYQALQQGIPESKLFVQDMGADGLRGASGGTADIVYMRGKDQRVINGDHEAAGVSEKDYRAFVEKTDKGYADLLTMLLNAARAQQSSGADSPGTPS